MSADDGIRAEEATPVQLTRMEGKLDLVNYQLGNHHARITVLESESSEQKSITQRLSEQAAARDATAVALALALKEADETRRTKSEQTWTPFQRGILLVSGLAGAAGLYLAIFPPR